MSASQKRIEVEIQSSGMLLEGISLWRHMGVISGSEAARLTHLHVEQAESAAPEPPVAAAPPAAPLPSPTATPVEEQRPHRKPWTATDNTAPARGRSALLQALVSELSVRWLLWLGVFLVVLSSGVLAVSFWRMAPPTGQYGVLFFYTLAFWGAGTWTERRTDLRTTARSVRTASLLLVPVNFWALESFGFAYEPAGLLLVTVAGATLSALVWYHWRRTAVARWTPALLVASCWLHLGWRFDGWGTAAVYAGCLGLCSLLMTEGRQAEDEAKSAFSLGFYGVVVLLAHALLAEGLPIERFGLAVGAIGCVATLRGRGQPSPWNSAGLVLMLIGWAVCVVNEPGQALAVTALSMGAAADRLIFQRQSAVLDGLFGLGLVFGWLLWRTWPQLFDHFSELLVRIAGPSAAPLPSLALALVCYAGLVHLLAVAARGQAEELVRRADILALGLGLLTVPLALLNPLLTAVLLGANGLLALDIARRANPALIDLAHGLGLATAAASVHWLWPDLASEARLLLAVGVSVLEAWLADSIDTPWRTSAARASLALGCLSFPACVFVVAQHQQLWGLIWLAVPTSLAWLGRVWNPARRTAFVALLAVQVPFVWSLIANDPTLALSLTVGAAVVGWQGQRHRSHLEVYLGVGMAAVAPLALVCVYSSLENRPAYLACAAALLALVLWWVRARLRDHSTSYWPEAAGAGASVLAVGTLILGTLIGLFAYAGGPPVHWSALAGAALVTGGLLWQTRGDGNKVQTWLAGWSIELTLALAVHLAGGSVLALSAFNFALGVGAQVAGDWWLTRSGRAVRPLSWDALPLIYALLGLLLRWGELDPWTALGTLSSALVALGIGRRGFKLLKYLGLALATAASYELLAWWVQQPNGPVGEALTLMAVQAAALMLLYRLLESWIRPYLQLSAEQWLTAAHLHWGSAILLTLPALGWFSGTVYWPAVGVLAGLAIYALEVGRGPDTHHSWTYAGLSLATVAQATWLWPALPATHQSDWAVVLACLTALALELQPLSRWGWPDAPGRRFGLLLPVVGLALAWEGTSALALLAVAGHYGSTALLRSRVRLSHLAVGFGCWAVLRWLEQWRVEEPFVFAVLFAVPLLWLVYAEPLLQGNDRRLTRHGLRLLAVGSVCLAAQAHVGQSLLWSMSTTGLAVGLVLNGLALRTRAYLYVGTAFLVWNACDQAWRFAGSEPLGVWAIGIVLGIGFIWLAANFESRREQVITLWHDLSDQLATWE